MRIGELERPTMTPRSSKIKLSLPTGVPPDSRFVRLQDGFFAAPLIRLPIDERAGFDEGTRPRAEDSAVLQLQGRITAGVCEALGRRRSPARLISTIRQ